MIQNKQDLKYYLAEDLKRFGDSKPKLKDWILHNEKWFIYHYIKHLRYIEYYQNTGKNKLAFLWHFFRYKRIGFKIFLNIFPNCVGPGFRVVHAGDRTSLIRTVTIGKNCTLLTGVRFGNKTENPPTPTIIEVGDNCYFGSGAKVFGSVKIGNNVTVGANAVITKDIPDNAVVGGVPAKIIRIKE